jgi:dTDP-4-dehydrorhamnose reductase
VNRVLDTVGDQTVKTGHENRPEDLDRFAALGITALRYPVLWERIAPDHPDILDWSWTDARLERLRALGIRPIAGLVHHGSGPKYTDLLDPGFATGLARFALAAAQR